MGNKVFVGGLSWDATDDDLKELFGECGTVTDGVILQDRETGRSRGFGFVTFSSDEEAKAAIEKFHDFEYMGRNLSVNEARPREDRGGGGQVADASTKGVPKNTGNIVGWIPKERETIRVWYHPIYDYVLHIQSSGKRDTSTSLPAVTFL